MKIQASDFSKVLTKIIPSIPAKSTMPILESVLLESKDGKTLTAKGGNLEQLISVTMPCTGKFAACIPVVKLKALIDTLSGEIDIDADVEKKRATIKEKGTHKLTCESTDEFPNEHENAGKTYTLEASSLVTLLEHTRFCTSTDELRPAMLAVCIDFDSLQAIATDGHKLAKYGDGEEGVNVPAKACDMILKLFTKGEITVTLGAQYLTVTDGQSTLQTRLIEEPYPNYQSVIPELSNNIVAVDRLELITNCKRVMLSSNDLTKQIRLTFAKDEITINAENMDTGMEGTDTVVSDYNGEQMTIGMNGQFFIDVLSHIVSKQVKLFLTSPSKAVLIKAGDESEQILSLVMPVRIAG